MAAESRELRIERLAARQPFAGASEPGVGLVMLEIDGLSYQRMQRALDQGIMPTAKRLVKTGKHTLAHTDCGLPSQTSACQAGIMYGDNYNIPAFRWYDKEQGRLYVSNNFKDAAEINGRYSNGQGLLRDGTSINNLMAGDANKAILTMSMLLEGPEDVDRRRFVLGVEAGVEVGDTCPRGVEPHLLPGHADAPLPYLPPHRCGHLVHDVLRGEPVQSQPRAVEPEHELRLVPGALAADHRGSGRFAVNPSIRSCSRATRRESLARLTVIASRLR